MQENYRSFTVELHDYTNEELVAFFQTTQQEQYLKELMVRNSGIIRKIAFSYSIESCMDMDDLMAIGYEELWRATKYYKADRGNKFITVLGAFIRQKYDRLYNYANREKRKAVESILSLEVLEDINKEHYVNDDHSNLYTAEYLKTLSGNTKKVAEILLKGFSKSEVANILGIAPASVSYHMKRLQSAYTAYTKGAVR